jgi:alanyl-tRNA synthetase
MINDVILKNIDLTTEILPYQVAIDQGAIGLFGEKYEEDVRVVSIKEDITGIILSKELCGGTHVERTGDIGLVKITSESAIAAGVRRIEAVAGPAALQLFQSYDDTVAMVADRLKVSKNNAQEIISKIDELAEAKKKVERDLFNLYVNNAIVTPDMLIINKSFEYGAQLFFKMFNNYDVKALKRASEIGANSYSDAIIVYCNKNQEKLNIIVSVGAEILTKLPAVEIAKKLASQLNSNSAGGNNSFAQISAVYSKELGNVSETIADFLCANT